MLPNRDTSGTNPPLRGEHFAAIGFRAATGEPQNQLQFFISGGLEVHHACNGRLQAQGCHELGLLFATAVTFLACSRAPAAIEHTVIILQENHTFDNYFGTFPGADGATSCLTSTGLVVPLSPMPDTDQASLCNSWDCGDPSHGCRQNGRLRPEQRRVGPYTQATEQ
jgi:Phosphoesterase family